MIVDQSRRAGLTQLADNRGLASLPVLQDMQEWWREWGPRIAKDVGRQGWILFLLDANEKLVETTMLMSRLLRNKPDWDTRGWSEAEWLRVDDQATAALRWFERHVQTLTDVPEFAQFLLSAQYGNFCALARVGRELRAAQEQGYTTVVLEEQDGGHINVAKGGHTFLTEVA